MPRSVPQTSGYTDFHKGPVSSTKKTLEARLARDLGKLRRAFDDENTGSKQAGKNVARNIPAECLYNFQ
ncbi:hypothetical protein LshimejAT787_0100800 [Lyophyllum shimeji]|uniref:Uncharacterized protein n=1 Tax=Lyophyllum shimeji TaxID=47721 RepID=A0A9P3PC96_LYOSH|nr:hypothetical protein LshimejAT787_0100800 [Lyophyllum shimeji]